MLLASDIQILARVAEIGSVNRACGALNMSQSTLSKLVHRIEHRLGAALFVRSGRGMDPTPVCRYIIDSGAGIENQLQRIERQAKLLAGGEAGVINLGVGPIVEELMLAEVLSSYCKAFPRITLDIRTDSEARLLDALAQDEVDVVVGPFDEQVRSRGFDIRHLVSQEVIFAARRGHPLAAKKRLRRGDLSEYGSALPHIPASIERQMPDARPDGTVSQRQFIRCEHYPTLKKVALTTDMLISGPQSLFVDELRSGELIKLGFKTGVVWHCGFVAKPTSLAAQPLVELGAAFEDTCKKIH